MNFEKWWEDHIETIAILRKDPNLEWIKPAFENCWISSENESMRSDAGKGSGD